MCVCVYKAVLSLFVIYFPLHALKNIVSTLNLAWISGVHKLTHKFTFSAAVYVNYSLSAVQ